MRRQDFHLACIIDALDGTVKALGKARWRWTSALAWVPDGSELLVVGKDHPESPFHVWRVGSPGGDVLNATNDANTYDGVSVPADASALLTMRISQTSALFTAPLAELGRARQLTPETTASFYGLDWTRDGTVLYGSSDGASRNIWVSTGHDAAVRLTMGEAVKQNPVATPDGRYIVYVSEQGGFSNVWRMNADGSGARQLTFGESANNPSVTPDSRWVVYDASSVGATRLFKVPVDGGTPDELTSKTSHYPAVSPDGKAIAFRYYPGGTAPATLSIAGIGGGTPHLNFRVPADAWQWEPGGRALIYVDNAGSRFMPLLGAIARGLPGLVTARILPIAGLRPRAPSPRRTVKSLVSSCEHRFPSPVLGALRFLLHSIRPPWAAAWLARRIHGLL